MSNVNLNSVGAQIARRDFSAATIAGLAARGIALISVQALPVADSWINADRGFVVDDNDTCRVWTHAQVIAAASARGDAA